MSEQLEIDATEMTILAEYQAQHEALRSQSTRLLLMALSDPTVSSISQEVETWKELYEDIYGHSGEGRGPNHDRPVTTCAPAPIMEGRR